MTKIASKTISQEMYEAFMELVQECNDYEGVAQTDENFEYGNQTALGRINNMLLTLTLNKK